MLLFFVVVVVVVADVVVDVFGPYVTLGLLKFRKNLFSGYDSNIEVCVNMASLKISKYKVS